MLITVAICTWNRADLLNQTLTQMAFLRVPLQMKWELLVVDNNSSDSTDEVVRRHDASLPLRLLREPRQGLSNARNTAVREAKGDLILWTDDDVIVGPEWLANYAAAAEKHPGADYFGGPVRPWFPVPPPKWLEQQYQSCGWPWALIDRGPHERLLRAEESLIGANMGYRSSILKQHVFDPSLGHTGMTPRGGEELAVQREIQRSGGVGLWLPQCEVNHYVVPERMNLEYAWRRAFEDGRYSYSADESVPGKQMFGVPRWMLRKYAEEMVKYRLGRVFGGSKWLSAFIEAAKVRGAMASAREMAG